MADANLTDNGSGNWLLSGELVFSSVPALLEQAGEEISGQSSIEVDLKGIIRSDSAGLALLVEWLRESERKGNSIRFVNVPEQMMLIARVSGLDEILSFSVE